MKSVYYKGFLFFIFSVVFSCFILWLHDHKTVDCVKNNTLFIVCTTTIIADAVRSIGGDKVNVACLMGPGVDPHTYRACEGDVHRMSKADIIFYNGLHLEGRMQDVMSALSRTIKTVAVTDILDRQQLRYLTEDIYDPHVWHDVYLWRSCVLYIAQCMMDCDPDNADYYMHNAQMYDQILQNVDTYCMQKIAQLPKDRRVVVTAHDAFYYCAQRYNFSVVGIQGMSTEAEVTMHDIEETVTLIVAHSIPAIFVESSVSPRAIQAVQEGVAHYGRSVVIGSELYSDSLGNSSSNGATYETMIRHNIDAIVNALSSQ